MGNVKGKLPTRLRILHATADSLTRKGYTATGLNEIIEQSGAPKGSLYHYFPDGKEQLATEALALSTGEWFEHLNAIMQAAADPPAAIREVCRIMADDLRESNWQNGCPIATVTLEVASTMPKIQKVADDHWKRWRQNIREYFTAHNTEIPDAVITTAISAFEGALLLARAHQSELPLLQVGETLASLFQALKKPP